ncbi:MAG TPA: hypothetical protein VKQ36_04810 [Ktedonobacterales bacterium]|nr:hypothetical protein [Ktedonobacterales bacterium]
MFYVMNIAVGIVVVVIIMMMTLKFLALFTDTPLFRTRVWPWLRLHPWWPVPAERTAETLLRHLLSIEQYRALCVNGYLDIPSPAIADRIYRVPRGPGQVQVIERGELRERLCVQPAANGMPDADVVLMHKLLIESDERAYLLTANHFPRAIWY